MARRRKKTSQPDVDLDLTPMIDVIFLLIIFFILAGKITAEIANEEITVPPTQTAQKYEPNDEWSRQKIEVWGNTQGQDRGMDPYHKIKIGFNEFEAKGKDNFEAYISLREVLDQVYTQADKYPDPNGTGMMLPKVILEVRADADTEYRVVQEILQVASDSVDPTTLKPKVHAGGFQNAKPFVNIMYTTRLPGE